MFVELYERLFASPPTPLPSVDEIIWATQVALRPSPPEYTQGALLPGSSHFRGCGLWTSAPWGAAPPNPLHLGGCAQTFALWGCAPKLLRWPRFLITMFHRLILLVITNEYYGGQHGTPKWSYIGPQAVSQNEN